VAAMALAGLLFTAASSTSFADQVYRSVDAQGHVTYSDRPTAPGAKKTDIAVQQADQKEADRLARENQLLKADDTQRTQREAADSQAKAKQDADKKRLCESARNHYNDLKSANRIYTMKADGTRDYYSDEKADAMRQEAQRTMQAACGS